MPSPPASPSRPAEPFSAGRTWLVAAVIFAAVWIAYANSLHVPLLFDDLRAIAQNPTIHRLWDLGAVLSPLKDSGVSGRPVLNLSFALNYAAGGEAVFGYHVVNLLIHALAALTLFGVVRRTLRAPRLHDRFAPTTAGWLAAAIALLWAVHPLSTEAVTYLSQRAESLMGLFYLLTIYAFLRGAEGAPVSDRRFSTAKSPHDDRSAPRARPAVWLTLSLLAWLLGLATKESIVTAPATVLLLDAIFVAGSFRAAWRARRGYYAGLAAGWLVLAWFMLTLGRHTIGFGHGIDLWTCVLTECGAVVRYAGLTLCPYPLVFDYGVPWVHDPLAALPAALALLALLAGTAWLLRRAPAAGFAALWFFLLLAPTSSVVPVVLQPIAESRVYLPLAGVLALLVLGAHRLIGAHLRWAVPTLAAVALAATIARNADYRDAVSLWSDTVVRRPDNRRAQDHLGTALVAAGRLDDAITHYRQAVQLAPDDSRLQFNLAKALHDRGLAPESIATYETALRLDPDYAEAAINLAAALAESGRNDRAAELLRREVQRTPRDARTHYNLGLALLRGGDHANAIDEFQRALALADPSLDLAAAHLNLGHALFALDRAAEAKSEFDRAAQLRPASAEAHTSLGLATLQLGDARTAAREFTFALQLDPADAEAHFRLGNILAMSGRVPEAMPHWQESLRLRPANAEAHNNLGLALAQSGRLPEAIGHFEEALRLNPGYDRARNNLADARAAQK